VSERDREYLRRLGDYKAESHAEALQRHRCLSLAERLRRSWALSQQLREHGTTRWDDPSPLYDRARALGLYRE
jgi:hypothetical protein